MQTTSALYNQIMADINRCFEVKLVIDGVEYGTDTIFSAKTESRIFDNKPTIGGCYSATLDFSIISDGASIPRMASVIPYFRVVNDTQQSEWVQHGLFFIDQRKVTNNGDNLSVFTAECFDAMLKANAVYGTSSLNWPATDTQVVAEIAAAIGVAVDPRTTAMLTKGFTIPAVPVEYTYRDILSFIGVVYAGNWIISDEGKLRLVPIGGNSDTLNIGKELMSMNVSPKRNGYTKVVITISDGETIESGSSDDMVMDAYCPYATQAIADDILTALSTYQYEPFDASGVWSDPAVEVGDKVTAVEKTVVSYARTVNYGPGMVMNLSAPDDGFIDHEYAYESPSERRYTRTIGDLKSEITLNENKIALVVSETAGGLEVNAASIVAAINDSGSSVIIDADKIDLQGYVTFTNLSTPGQTIIDGGNITANTITADKINLTDLFSQNITATNFHLNGGSINIDATSVDENVIRISGYVSGERQVGIFMPSSIYFSNYNSLNELKSDTRLSSIGIEIRDFVANKDVRLRSGGLSIFDMNRIGQSIEYSRSALFLGKPDIAIHGIVDNSSTLFITPDSYIDIVYMGTISIISIDLQFTNASIIGTSWIRIGYLDSVTTPFQNYHYFLQDVSGKCACEVLFENGEGGENTIRIRRFASSDPFPNDGHIIGTFPIIFDVKNTP